MLYGETMTDDPGYYVGFEATPVAVEPRQVELGELACAPCGIVLMRASTSLRVSRAVETIVLCPSCGAKLRWR
jgi:predicted RNA-binding Zn-ribbon protein involved in translation (DUF1610 family)